MGSGIFYPVASGDDGRGKGGFDATNDYGIIGYDNSAPKGIFCRFPNVTIPQGATVTDATFHAFSYTERGGTVYSNIYANNVDDAVAPTNGAELTALVKTAAFVTWDNMPTANPPGHEHISGDISAVLNEVFARSGWRDGNALQIIWEDNGSAKYSYRMVSFIDYDSGNYKMELHVEWTEPGQEANPNIFTWDPQAKNSAILLSADLLTASRA